MTTYETVAESNNFVSISAELDRKVLDRALLVFLKIIVQCEP